MNLPNALTVLRIFLVPLLVVVLLTRIEGHVYLGTGIFLVAVLTDYLDGFFARRRNEVTRLGILLDPLADKLLTAAAFLSLVEMGLVPAWAVMIILARELSRQPTVLIASQPTRGVDIGATEYIHKRLIEQRAQGTAILLISEDLDEVLALADRVAVIYEGEIAGIVSPDTPVDDLGLMMAGAKRIGG